MVNHFYMSNHFSYVEQRLRLTNGVFSKVSILDIKDLYDSTSSYTKCINSDCVVNTSDLPQLFVSTREVLNLPLKILYCTLNGPLRVLDSTVLCL